MSVKTIVEKALEQGRGILRLAPNWVPRSFCVPGRRIKLHPDDYYAMGGERGGIDERWFASTTPADNGPLTSPNEGLSFVVFEDGDKTERVLLRDAIEELQGEIIGNRIWKKHGAGPCTRSSSTTRAPCRTISIIVTSTPSSRASSASPRRTSSRPRSTTTAAISPTPSSASIPARRRTRSASACRTSSRATTRSRASRAGLSPRCRHRLGRPAGRAARAGQPVHLRAAEGLGCLRHVPDRSRATRSCPKELLWKDTPKNKHGRCRATCSA